MSKMDNLRALRESRYAAAATATAPAARSRATATVARRPSATSTASAEETTPEGSPAETGAEDLCGHRNMGGRTCTRERGHAAKSHRYS